jgi:hypothetical protein
VPHRRGDRRERDAEGARELIRPVHVRLRHVERAFLVAEGGVEDRDRLRQRLRQFENGYVERYWKILDELSLDALRISDPPISPSDEKVIRSYFILCEDELEMRASGYISDNTYKIWTDGIFEQLKQPMFADIWKNITEETGNEGNFRFAYLRSLIEAKESDRTYDPLLMSRPEKMVRGLKGIRGI